MTYHDFQGIGAYRHTRPICRCVSFVSCWQMLLTTLMTTQLWRAASANTFEGTYINIVHVVFAVLNYYSNACFCLLFVTEKLQIYLIKPGSALVTSSTAYWFQDGCSCVQGVTRPAATVAGWRLSALDRHRPPITASDPLMSWRVPQREHIRVSEKGVSPSLDHLSGTLCLSHYVTETSHLYSLRDYWLKTLWFV